MGKLTRDPEIRHTQSNLAVVGFGLAINERFKDRDGNWQERAHFIDCTVFGKRGEAFAQYHSKGSSAFVEGRLNMDQWDDRQTGKKRSKLGVVVDSWQFVGGKSEQASAGGRKAPAPVSYDDIPEDSDVPF